MPKGIFRARPGARKKVAIGTVTVGILKAGSGSAAGLSAYITRSIGTDHITQKPFDFRSRSDELVCHGLIIPPDAPDWARDPEQLWKRATEKQMTLDRKTGDVRFKVDAQVAKTFVFALPRSDEITLEEAKQLATDTVHEWFAGRGVAAQWALHCDQSGYHVHVIQSTNSIGKSGFGNKARWMNPNFGFANGKSYVSEDDRQKDRWSAYQNKWFSDHGITDKCGEPLTCDPEKIAAERTRGHSATQIAERTGSSEVSEQNASLLAETQEALRANPSILLKHATRMDSTFTARDLERILTAHSIRGIEAHDLIDRALSDDSVIQARQTGKKDLIAHYTTYDVVVEERVAIENVRAIARGNSAPVDYDLAQRISNRLTLRQDQADAFAHQLQKAFSLVIGDPGTGKSHLVRALREYKEAQGKDCIAVGPTNSVKDDMKRDGFKKSATLTRTLGDIERGKLVLTRNSVVICDEGAMVDTAQMSKLLRAVARSGAELHIVGDNKQLSSVPRGGIFTEIEKEFGASRLTYITRQSGWQQQASTDLSSGNVYSAIAAYESHGCIKHNDTLEASKKQLVSEWNGKDFVFAGLRKSVADLNAMLREKAIALKLVETKGVALKTKSGVITVSRGDRLQMSGNLNKSQISNGTVCTVRDITKAGLIVRFDGDKKDKVIPRDFQDLSHGYAGTVYRGQGKSIPGVQALHDSAFMWSAETGLVGLTRHKEAIKFYTSNDIAKDNSEMIRQLSVSRAKRAAISYDLGPTDRQIEARRAEREALRIAEDARVAREHAAAVERTRVDQERQEAQARAAAAFAARTKELAAMLRDGRSITISESNHFTIPGMTDNPEILADLQQRPDFGVFVRDALDAQTARDEAARIAAAEAARIAAERAALETSVQVGIGTFRQLFEQEKAARAAAEAERQRLAEAERQRAAEAERQRQRAAEAMRPRSRGYERSM